MRWVTWTLQSESTLSEKHLCMLNRLCGKRHDGKLASFVLTDCSIEVGKIKLWRIHKRHIFPYFIQQNLITYKHFGKYQNRRKLNKIS